MRRVLTSVGVVMVLLGIAGAPAHATFPGRPGKVAFSRSGTGTFPSAGDIWIASPSGKQRRLTHSAKADDTDPAFSRNGRLIAWVRRDHGNADIWVMHANGSHKHLVVGGPEDELEPSFYPGGGSIVFSRLGSRSTWTAYSIRIDGTHQKIQAQNATFPIVSPNGRWLAYTRVHGEGGGIRLMNLKSGATRRLTTGSAQELDFSPNGRTIAFTGQRRCSGGGDLRFALLKVGIHDRHATIIRRSCNREFIDPAWSPNGRKLLFVHKKLAAHGADLRFRLGIMLPNGVQVGGAPHHRRGTDELFPSWQPLPRR
jgi:Tol biopolymer transport system component